MRAFRDGAIDVLVATTVIEVGIDVPNATVMLIEHPERFGLSQLHQLRGRVGRGERGVVLHPAGRRRARKRRSGCELFASTEDGFEIARADLRLRGMGDLFGEQQSGDRDVPGGRPAARRGAQRAAREVIAERDAGATTRSSTSPRTPGSGGRSAPVTLAALELFRVG